MAKMFPKTVIFTSEFDFLLTSSLELATKLRKNGRLHGLCIHPGTHHQFFLIFEFLISDLFYNDFTKAINIMKI